MSPSGLCACMCPPNTTIPIPTTLPASEQTALEVLYNAMNGAHWIEAQGWMNHSMPHCDWHGVACTATVDHSTDEWGQHVHRLDLSNNGLTGSLPSEIGRLTQLSVLMLSDNGLTGSLPSEIGRLTQLSYLALSLRPTPAAYAFREPWR